MHTHVSCVYPYEIYTWYLLSVRYIYIYCHIYKYKSIYILYNEKSSSSSSRIIISSRIERDLDSRSGSLPFSLRYQEIHLHTFPSLIPYHSSSPLQSSSINWYTYIIVLASISISSSFAFTPFKPHWTENPQHPNLSFLITHSFTNSYDHHQFSQGAYT